MEPLVWWWRLWSGVIDPEQRNELHEARALADEEQQRAMTLGVRLADVERERDELRTRLDAATRSLEDANSELHRVQDHAIALEGEVAELRERVDELTGAEREVAKLRARVDELAAAEGEVANLRARVDELTAAEGEVAKLRERVDELAGAEREAAKLRERVDELAAAEHEAADTETAGTDTDDAAAAEPDLAAAAHVLGRRIRLDDLTVIEGVGPKIAELLAEAGITTWAQLASAEPERLRAVLDDAGPRYRVHDPSSWPAQADALASGQWERFADLRSRPGPDAEA